MNPLKRIIFLSVFLGLSSLCQAQDTDSISQYLQLEEVVVKASPVRHSVNKDIYMVSDSMIAKSANTMELLDKLQGVRYDRFNNSIKIANRSNILFTLDGKSQTAAYIMNLNPELISRIEIIRSPKGKYASEGYDAVINVVTQKDADGYNVNLSNFLLTNLSGDNNGSDWLMSEQPSINTSYTTRHFNLYGNYTHGTARWNTPMERQVDIAGLYSRKSTPLDDAGSNDKYRYMGNGATLGINYSIDKADAHVVSAEVNFLGSRIRNTDKYDYTILRHQAASSEIWEEVTRNKTKDADLSGMLFYNGKIGEKTKLFGDVTYDYFRNDVTNRFSSVATDFVNSYKEGRRLFRYSFDAEHSLSERFSLTGGLQGNNKTYTSRHADFKYREYRQKLYGFAKYMPTEGLQLELGLGGEYISSGISETKRHGLHLLPSFQVSFQPNENLNVRGSYSTDMDYPTLTQLNPEKMMIDDAVSHEGNPSLKAALSHSFRVELDYMEIFSLAARYKYAPDFICDIIGRSGDGYKLTYGNIDFRDWSFEGAADIPLSQCWSLSLAGTYYLNKSRLLQSGHHVNGWFLDADLCYMSGTLMAQFGYHKNMDKRNKLQGFQEYDFDSWALMLNKQFFNNRFGLTLNYLLPLKWGTKDKQRRTVAMDDYSEVVYTGIKPYRSALVLQLTYRFSGGKTRQQVRKTSVTREERITRTF